MNTTNLRTRRTSLDIVSASMGPRSETIIQGTDETTVTDGVTASSVVRTFEEVRVTDLTAQAKTVLALGELLDAIENPDTGAKALTSGCCAGHGGSTKALDLRKLAAPGGLAASALR